ncbi:MAG: 3-phosphoshikimate 1-carboxyvinyltransferase [Bacteroidetes bacterium]|nr:3-phosphoshikimate 1-carboxyvinyltransferase [Bacteroidota bacterium]HET6243010.1 3-phosphoshikimate 1-carboxyvinyltransferase [Bacteroidia bacterium]
MINAIYIKRKKGEVSSRVNLPGSKSITNRAFIINALSGGRINIINPSDAEDSIVLKNLLDEQGPTFDVGHAGTVMRFLAALFSIIQGERILTGSERMKQRPVKELIRVLSSIGADIQFLGKKGFPPLKIKGKKLSGGKVDINSTISSQYVSAMLMIAPYLENGLVISLKGRVISAPYIEMTLDLMKKCGAKIHEKDTLITVASGEYTPADIIVEKDWSAASYWYELVAISYEAEITLSGLSKQTIQGDSVLDEIFKNFGVRSKEIAGNTVLIKLPQPILNRFDYDFTNCPDLAQAVAVTMAAKGIKGILSGITSLRIKETDRISALSTELEKLGVATLCGADYIEILGDKINKQDVTIETYQDHRMAMAFAPLAEVLGEIRIKNPGVVKKSYPGFWIELENAGFEITV